MATMSAVNLRQSSAEQGSRANPATLSAKNYAFLQQYIHTQSGIVIEEGKQYLLEARLVPLLREHNIDSLDMLAAKLATRSSSLLARQVIDAMTTNETLFFRDQIMFEALRTTLIAKLKAQIQTGRPLRVWSAASSSGQEAYSLAMMLLDMGFLPGTVEIVGTDLSEQVLERARQGTYVQFEVNRGLPAASLVKYFLRKGMQWQLKDEVRRMVRFAPLDLRQNLSQLGTFDLVLCRNVLIYFDMKTKKEILISIKKVLAPGGILLLGCAESINNVYDGYKRNTVDQTTYYTA